MQRPANRRHSRSITSGTAIVDTTARIAQRPVSLFPSGGQHRITSAFAKSAEITGIDTTDPGIAFPSNWAPTTGVSGTIALTDSNAKIKKYGAIPVVGTSTTAALCDQASEITGLTTLDTPLATVNYAYAPPADSATKKVCVYAEDAAGNIEAQLWSTAIAQSVPAKPAGLSLTAGDTQVTLSWTDPSDATITKYQYQQKAGTNAYGSWTNIPSSAPGQTNATSYTVTGLTQRHGLPVQDPRGELGRQQRRVRRGGSGDAVVVRHHGPHGLDHRDHVERSLDNSESHYRIGDTIAVTVTFNEALTVTGSPTLKIRIGSGAGSEKSATCAKKGTSGDDAKALVCSYTVAEGDADSDGIAVEAGKLAGTIKDASNNDATLTYTAIAAQSGHKVDGVRPTVVVASTGYYSNAALVERALGDGDIGHLHLLQGDLLREHEAHQEQHRPDCPISGGCSACRALAMNAQRLGILDADDALTGASCKPNHASNTDVYICHVVTVSSLDTEGTTDPAPGWARRAWTGRATRWPSVYDHASQLTIDNRGPGRRVPAGRADGGECRPRSR